MSSTHPFGAGAVDLAAHMAAKQSSGMPGYDDMTKGIDVLDSEIIDIQQTLERLTERARVSRRYDDFDREIKERFAEIGFVVDVLWYETNLADTKMPEVVIKGRTEAKVFDRDRMTHEVTNDLLGLGEGGVIKTDKDKVSQMMDGSYKGNAKGVHKH